MQFIYWMPAFAGMTVLGDSLVLQQPEKRGTKGVVWIRWQQKIVQYVIPNYKANIAMFADNARPAKGFHFVSG